jgi:hypothetical protein
MASLTPSAEKIASPPAANGEEESPVISNTEAPTTLATAGESKKHQVEQALAAILQDGYALKSMSNELKNNKEVVLAAVSNDGSALEYASEELHNDKDVVLAAVSNDGQSIGICF